MDIDYRAGLKKLKILARETDWYPDFLIHEHSLLVSLSEYEKYHDEHQRSNIARTVDQLNRLSWKHLKIAFNDLCKEEEGMFGVSQPPILGSTNTSSGQQDVYSSSKSVLYSNGSWKMRRWAVLVGVNKYEDNRVYGDLKYCADDVKKLHKVLLDGGFEEETIRTLSDHEILKPKKEYILPTLEQVANLTGPDDLLLFYFGGHGLAQNGESYLIPSNARGTSLLDVAIQVRRVKEIIEHAKAKMKVLIFDACHSGERLGVRGTEPMSEEFMLSIGRDSEGLAILSSCKQEERSYDWEEKKCGVFSNFLSEALSGKADPERKKGYITVNDVNIYVCHNVRKWTNSLIPPLVQNPVMHLFVSGEIPVVQYKIFNGQEDVIGDSSLFPAKNIENEEVIEEKKASLKAMLDIMEQNALYLHEVTEHIRRLLANPNSLWAAKIHDFVIPFRKKMAENLLVVEKEYQIDKQFKDLTIEMPYFYGEYKKLIDGIEKLCTVKNSRRKQDHARQTTQRVTRLQGELLKFQDRLITIRQENDIGPPEEDSIEIPISSLERYVGDMKALRGGKIHSVMKDKLQEKGISAHEKEKSGEEDILERFLEVPLHAVFLYTTQDTTIESYILSNWNALESLSGNNCDIYFSVAQTKDREDAYKQIRELDVIKQANFVDITQLPGLFFWDKSGATAYISFGFDPEVREITRILRIVFYEIEKDVSIVSILRAQRMLRPSD